MASRSNLPSRFFTVAERTAIAGAIAEAEAKTSGEIRVHVERHCRGDAQAAAKKAFEKIGMHRTAAKNGVLVYLAVADHAFAVIGDAGIDAKVEKDFWEQVSSRMGAAFREDRFGDGVAGAVREIGERLSSSFPRGASDANELPDDVSVNDA